MVFEQLFKTTWIEKRPRHAFVMGVLYSLLGIISARLIFGTDPGLMTVAFTSLLLIPSLNILLQDEENVEIREKKLSIHMLVKDHKDIFEIYVFLFLGIFFTYALLSVILPSSSTGYLFKPQLSIGGLSGEAFNPSIFTSIVLNNLKVLMVCFLLSLIYGAGSIMFLTWNASVWGSILGFMAQQSAFQLGQNPVTYFIASLVPILPHLITEAVSYFSASIAGGVVSKAVIREDLFSKKFNHILTDALIFVALGFILVVIAAVIEVRLL